MDKRQTSYRSLMVVSRTGKSILLVTYVAWVLFIFDKAQQEFSFQPLHMNNEWKTSLTKKNDGKDCLLEVVYFLSLISPSNILYTMGELWVKVVGFQRNHMADSHHVKKVKLTVWPVGTQPNSNRQNVRRMRSESKGFNRKRHKLKIPNIDINNNRHRHHNPEHFRQSYCITNSSSIG